MMLLLLVYLLDLQKNHLMKEFPKGDDSWEYIANHFLLIFFQQIYVAIFNEFC